MDEAQLTVPETFAHIPAVGAAVIASQAAHGAGLANLSELRSASDTARGRFPTQEPLSMANVVLLRDQVEPYEAPYGRRLIDAYLGIDVGSVSTNLAVIDEDGRVITEIYTPTDGRPIEVVSAALGDIQSGWADRLRIRGVGTTGSGRELVGQLVGADTIKDEITCHKTGAMYVGRTMLGGRVPDTIFEIGGQDSKYISLDGGVVVDFTMNEACAAGTGSFLEERADELDIAIKGQFAQLALASDAPIRLGERCTVFMERDVNSYLQRGAAKPDLVAGLAYSVVYNYINRVVRGRRIGDCIFFQGGTAYNDAVAAALAAVTGKEIIVPPHNGVIGAIGAALLARDKMKAKRSDSREGVYVSEQEGASRRPTVRSRFRGYDMSKVDYKLREFTCKGCSNACQIQEFDVEGEKTYWGDKCSERYRKHVKAERKAVIEDLFALREKLLLEDPDRPPAGDDALTVGIPLTMFALEHLPFWRTLLAGCGYRVVLSDPTNKRIVQAGLDSVVAEPCFPIIVAHGHIADLLDKGVDYILLPNVVSMATRWPHTNSYLCPWNQTLPFVCRRAPALERFSGKFLTPQLRFRRGRQHVRKALQRFFKPLGVPGETVSVAVDAAFAAQQRFDERRLAAGRRAMAKLEETSEPALVVVGRPYNVHDAGVNLSVPRKLRDIYGVNCLPLDFLDTESIDVRDVNDRMYWHLGRRVLAAAKIVGAHDNLHILHITNFKCGPDSFIKHFIRGASGKPFLTLQFDGHSNDAGIMTRCEAYLDSKGILRPWRTEEFVPTPA
ncbi:MAG: acyl-CoA dehydratase activase-related protein [Planctomycetota bacterium]|jgi:predicted CoA-substrate-specific enzyme activase